MLDAVICCLIGVLLGTQFRMGILVPVAMFAALAVFWHAAELPSVWHHLALQVIALSALQLGYLAGALGLSPQSVVQAGPR